LTIARSESTEKAIPELLSPLAFGREATYLGHKEEKEELRPPYCLCSLSPGNPLYRDPLSSSTYDSGVLGTYALGNPTIGLDYFLERLPILASIHLASLVPSNG